MSRATLHACMHTPQPVFEPAPNDSDALQHDGEVTRNTFTVSGVTTRAHMQAVHTRNMRTWTTHTHTGTKTRDKRQETRDKRQSQKGAHCTKQNTIGRGDNTCRNTVPKWAEGVSVCVGGGGCGCEWEANHARE